MFDCDTDISMEKKSEVPNSQKCEEMWLSEGAHVQERRCRQFHTKHVDARLTQAEFTRVAKVTPGGLIEVPDAEGKSDGAKLMTPKKRVADDLTMTYLKKDDSQSEMHIMHRDKTTQMYNECIAEHASLIDS